MDDERKRKRKRAGEMAGAREASMKRRAAAVRRTTAM
jgi:ribosome assembly protein YihI (activator of Der GTPase)